MADKEKKEYIYNWWDLNLTDLRRKNWWEPYTQKTSGIGMSVPYEEDDSQEYKIKRRKVKSLKVYGLERDEHFLPMIACFEFRNRSLVFDRAIHNTGEMRLVELKTHKEIEKVTGIPYIIISENKKAYDAELFSEDKFPFDSSVNQLEKLVEECSSKTVSKFIIGGNDTCAVGLLIGRVIILFKEKFYLKMGNVKLDKDKISKTLGEETSKNLSNLYVLYMKFGRYK